MPRILAASRRFAPAIFGLVLVLAPPSARAQQLVGEQVAVDGDVQAAHAVDDILYLGGQFTEVARATGPGVPIDPVSGAIEADFPKVSNQGGDAEIRCVVADGAGGFFLGGRFDAVGGVPRASLAHIDANLAVTAWNPGANGLVEALAVDSGVLYVGGSFGTIGGVARPYLAAVDAGTGAVTGWNPGCDGSVLVIAATATAVHVGGIFAHVGGAARSCLASLSPTTGLATAFDAGISDADVVRTLVVGGSVLYFAGQFQTVGGSTRYGIAAVNAATGAVLAWNPGVDGPVFALGYDGTRVYAGGHFAFIGSRTRYGLAALNLTNGQATTWIPRMNAYVSDLEIDGDLLVVGGPFTSVGGQVRTRLAAFDRGTGQVTAWAPSVGFSGEYVSVLALARSGSRWYAGGEFTVCDPEARANLAAIDLATHAVLPWNPGAVGRIRALAGDASGPLYVGGDFSSVGGAPRARLAAVDRTSGVPTPWNPSPSHTVLTLKLQASTLYAGGLFQTIGGQTRGNAAAFDTGTGALTGWNPSPLGDVYCIVPDGQRVWIGGAFEEVGGLPRECVAAVDAGTGAPTAWNPEGPRGGVNPYTFESIPPFVATIAVEGSTAFIGGRFLAIGGELVTNLAALDAATGTATPWGPAGTDSANFGYSNYVSSLILREDEILVAGYFSMMGGQPRASLASVERVTGNATAWRPDPDTSPRLADLGPRGIAAFGFFEDVERTPLQGLALFTNPLGPIGVPVPSGVRPGIALSSIAPHPLSGRGRVQFTLPVAGAVTLELLDVAGRRRRTLLDRMPAPAGTSSVALERGDLPAGVYLVRLSMNGESATRKLIVTP
jgi:hypothetical protein